jgi:hypothetical protein
METTAAAQSAPPRTTDGTVAVHDRASGDADAGTDGRFPGSAVAVLIPCFNEAVTIETVVAGFQASLPDATVYVYDNNSSDETVALATRAGATVRHEPLQGKGNVVRRMFADIEADVYLLVDGDDTYDASAAARLVDLVIHGGFDLVNAERVTGDADSLRRGHAFGNKLLAGLVTRMFGRPSGDMLSGYKACSRRFVKSFPVSAGGFEIETELTVHALGLTMPTTQVRLPYRERPDGSESKLSTVSDGVRIVRMISGLVRSERPLAFFSMVAGVLAAVAVILGIPLVLTFAHTHEVPRVPTAILATGLVIVACLCLTAGVILDTVTRGRREAKMLRYLAFPGPLAHALDGVAAGGPDATPGDGSR